MSEEQARMLLQKMQTLEAYVVNMEQRQTALLDLVREATASIESLKTLKEKPSLDTLVPVGLGAYVQGTMSSNDKIFLNIGSNIVIEKDTNSAMNYLEARIKELGLAIQDVDTKKREAISTLEQGKMQLNQMMQTASQNLSSDNV